MAQFDDDDLPTFLDRPRPSLIQYVQWVLTQPTTTARVRSLSRLQRRKIYFAFRVQENLIHEQEQDLVEHNIIKPAYEILVDENLALERRIERYELMLPGYRDKVQKLKAKIAQWNTTVLDDLAMEFFREGEVQDQAQD